MPVATGKVVNRSISGTGIGLRHCHIQHVLEQQPKIPWFEILADNHLEAGGPVKRALEMIRQDYAFSFHCVGMSLAGTNSISIDYLRRLKRLKQELEPGLISDHLSFSCFTNQHYHELLPIPYTEESLAHVCQRVSQVQDFLGQQILIENPSSYLSYRHSTISESEFLNALAEQADCFILLDVNNVFVSASNHEYDSNEFITGINYERVREIHLGGFEDRGHYLLDAHNHPVSHEVWQLFELSMQYATDIPALIEWDNDIPGFDVLLEQAQLAEQVRSSITTACRIA